MRSRDRTSTGPSRRALLAGGLALALAPATPAASADAVAAAVRRAFLPRIAAPGRPRPGRSLGILVGVTVAGRRHHVRLGRVPTRSGSAIAPEDTVFFIGSNTKVVTGTLLALARAAAADPVALSTPVRDLLPSGIVIREPHGTILLRHLATHSAGFPRGICGPRPAFGDYPFTSMTAFLERFEPPFAPGRYWLYSNQGFALLGVLMSHAYAGGKSAGWDASYRMWPVVAVDRITAPLGMPTTGVDYAAVAGQVAQGYRYAGEAGAPAYRPVDPPRWVPTSAGLGSGALSSTLTDMLTFLEAQIDPPPGPLGEAIALSQAGYPVSGVHSMGLGWHRGNGYVDKNGGVPGYQSYMAVDPASRIGIVAFGNTSGGASLTVAGRAVLEALRGRPAERPPFPRPPTTPRCPSA